MPANLVEGSILQEQIDLETQAVRDGVTRYRRLARQAIERGDGASLKPAERMILYWMDAMRLAIEAERSRIIDGAGGQGRAVYGPTLLLLDTDRAAFLALHELLGMTMAEPSGVKFTRAVYAVGRAWFAEINFDLIRKDWEVKKGLTDRVRRLNPVKINWWAKRELDDAHWDRNVLVKLGAWLVDTMASVCAVNEYTDAKDFRPAFFVQTRWTSPKRQCKFIGMTDQLDKLIEDGHSLRQFLRPRYQFMVIPPMPWEEDTDGGYVRIRTPYTTKPTPDQKDAIRKAPRKRANRAMNALSATPWRINKRIFDVAVQLWESGGGMASLPPRGDLAYPPKLDKDAPVSVRIERDREARAIHRRNHALRSHRRQVESVLQMASKFADRPRVWMPHRFDFRYRAMPIPQPLNHHGSDLCRGLLEYGEGRQPDTDYWLKVQMAGFCGYDKASMADRVAWCDDNMTAISAWADEPLENTGWMLMEDPWQALASAMSLTDPEAAAHIPFRTDGSCNALQHYAAIGRDHEAAGRVNLLPADRPNDVYLDVLARVCERVEHDAGTSDKVYRSHDREMPLSKLAEKLLEVLVRKVVKQTAMTTMYDVTDVGAKRQTRGQLKRVGLKDAELYLGGKYLAKLVVECAIQSVGAAGPIMAWLRDCARKIANTGELVRWTTPLEMPVVQPYRVTGSGQARTSANYIVIPDVVRNAPPSVGRQRRGCPPNYIHSIDSTHMLMSAQVAHDEGIHFAAVHDSFWCHAADAERTGRILREQFIELHEIPLLEGLYAEWDDNYPSAQIDPPPPPVGTLDLNSVLEATYAFA